MDINNILEEVSSLNTKKEYFGLSENIEDLNVAFEKITNRKRKTYGIKTTKKNSVYASEELARKAGQKEAQMASADKELEKRLKAYFKKIRRKNQEDSYYVRELKRDLKILKSRIKKPINEAQQFNNKVKSNIDKSKDSMLNKLHRRFFYGFITAIEKEIAKYPVLSQQRVVSGKTAELAFAKKYKGYVKKGHRDLNAAMQRNTHKSIQSYINAVIYSIKDKKDIKIKNEILKGIDLFKYDAVRIKSEEETKKKYPDIAPYKYFEIKTQKDKLKKGKLILFAEIGKIATKDQLAKLHSSDINNNGKRNIKNQLSKTAINIINGIVDNLKEEVIKKLSEGENFTDRKDWGFVLMKDLKVEKIMSMRNRKFQIQIVKWRSIPRVSIAMESGAIDESILTDGLKKAGKRIKKGASIAALSTHMALNNISKTHTNIKDKTPIEKVIKQEKRYEVKIEIEYTYRIA